MDNIKEFQDKLDYLKKEIKDCGYFIKNINGKDIIFKDREVCIITICGLNFKYNDCDIELIAEKYKEIINHIFDYVNGKCDLCSEIYEKVYEMLNDMSGTFEIEKDMVDNINFEELKIDDNSISLINHDDINNDYKFLYIDIYKSKLSNADWCDNFEMVITNEK